MMCLRLLWGEERVTLTQKGGGEMELSVIQTGKKPVNRIPFRPDLGAIHGLLFGGKGGGRTWWGKGPTHQVVSA